MCNVIKKQLLSVPRLPSKDTAVYYRQFCAFILCVALLPACSKKPTSGTIRPDVGFLYEEKIADVPLPRALSPVPGYQDIVHGQNLLLARYTSFDTILLEDFYMRMLEQMGWRLSMHCTGVESLMVWEKQYRVCVVSIRACTRKTLLVIHVGHKKITG